VEAASGGAAFRALHEYAVFAKHGGDGSTASDEALAALASDIKRGSRRSPATPAPKHGMEWALQRK